MKNYYEILEVDTKASKEVIEKAFKVLAKKYHPDAHNEEKKEWAEGKFKEINEAYEILSDKEKKKNYDEELDYAKNAELQALQVKNAELELLVASLKSELKSLSDKAQKYNAQNNYYNTNTYKPNMNMNYHKPFNESPYYNTNQTNTINYKKNFFNKNRLKDLIAFIITICCILAIAFIIWQIPLTRNMLIDIYESNPHIKNFVDFFLNL